MVSAAVICVALGAFRGRLDSAHAAQVVSIVEGAGGTLRVEVIASNEGIQILGVVLVLSGKLAPQHLYATNSATGSVFTFPSPDSPGFDKRIRKCSGGTRRDSPRMGCRAAA